jgi:hypothetical protein
MRRASRILTSVGAILAAAQLLRFTGTNPAVHGDLVAPVAVKRLLRRACYDCHSNETVWRWYGEVAPVSWLIHRDVNEGRRRLNFSEWADYAGDPDTASRKLDEISALVSSGEMAPRYYRILHPRARLTAAERVVLIRWGKQEAASPSPSHQPIGE